MKVMAELILKDNKGGRTSEMVTLGRKTFSSGRQGWYITRTLEVDGREVRVQVQAWERD